MERSDDAILKRLENKAVHYLGRYASTGARLEEVLHRFARRKLSGEDPERIDRLVRLKVEQCIERGYVDDGQYARRTAESMRLQGASRRKIRMKLAQAGVAEKVIDQAVEGRDAEAGPDAEAEAALRYARRRRLGPFARKEKHGDDWREKHFGSLARAGFDPSTAKFVLDFGSAAAAENWLDHPETR